MSEFLFFSFFRLVTSVCGVASESQQCQHTDILFTVYNNNRTVWSHGGRAFTELVEVNDEGNKTK